MILPASKRTSEIKQHVQDILAKLIRFQTVTGAVQPAHELLEYVSSFVIARGMHVERYISNDFESIVATTQYADKQPLIMLGAHADVVDAPDEQFELREMDGKLYGRGVLDMKGALAVFMQVIDDLQDKLPSLSLGLMVTMDEESGGYYGVAKLIEEGYRPGVVILPDGGDNWHVQSASKGVTIFKVTARGMAVHSSRHWQGKSAITTLLAAIPELLASVPNPQNRDSNTLAVSNIHAGQALSRIPDEAYAIFDMRQIDASSYQRLRERFIAVCQQHGLEYDILADGQPTKLDMGNPFVTAYLDKMQQVLKAPVKTARTLATNDLRFIEPLGIPAISFYPEGGDHHSANEWVSTAALEQMRTITREYVTEQHSIRPK